MDRKCFTLLNLVSTLWVISQARADSQITLGAGRDQAFPLEPQPLYPQPIQNQYAPQAGDYPLEDVIRQKVPYEQMPYPDSRPWNYNEPQYPAAPDGLSWPNPNPDPRPLESDGGPYSNPSPSYVQALPGVEYPELRPDETPLNGMIQPPRQPVNPPPMYMPESMNGWMVPNEGPFVPEQFPVYPQEQWNGVFYPNQGEPMDPYAPCPWGQPNDCNPPMGPIEPVPPFIPICEPNVCRESCRRHLGFDQGTCINNECYCKKASENEDHDGENENHDGVTEDDDSPEDVDNNKPDDMTWSYSDQDDWDKMYPKCSNATRNQQSPIDVKTSMFQESLNQYIRFSDHDKEVRFIVMNTGHGARLLLQAPKLPEIKVVKELDIGQGQVLKAQTYGLGSIDLHWGASEHTLEGQSYDVEAQFNYFDWNLSHPEDAVTKEGGVLSLAVLFQTTNSASDLHDEIFELLATHPDKVGVYSGLTRFFKDPQAWDQAMFAIYHGSLTTPPCSTTINWLVSQQIFQISPKQVEILTGLKDKSGQLISNNARKSQPIVADAANNPK
eukprot:maker-scaffold1253_size52701-snap-gene-0.10 protein:Tk01371 transcript:maker-scaffold1253_size52701-snap-gene-0.10-mRNA-1 annotation:"carbonic anhydrase 9-like"